MRIIGGEYKSRIIAMPKGVQIRPTQDKVREAAFNILGDISGWRVLELFAGSGAFGIEGLSRGAEHVTFIDDNIKCINMIRENLSALGVARERYTIIRTNALNAPPKLQEKQERFNLIFLDPPYYQEMAKKSLINIDACDIVTRIGFVMVEHFKKDELPKDLRTLAFIQERRYGDTNITIYKKINDKDKDSSLPRNV